MFGALRSGWSIPVSQHRTAMLRRVLGGSSRGELHNIVGGHPAVLPRTLERVPQACLSPRHGIPRAAARSMHVRMARVKRQAVTQGVSNTAGSVNRPRSFVQRWVFTVAVGTAALKTQLADLIAQMGIEGTPWGEVDWRRNLVFFSFGFGFLGVVLYGVYVIGFRRIFRVSEAFGQKPFREKLRDRAGMITLTKQVAADILIVSPFMYWPTFYLMKTFCFKEANDPRSLGDLCRDALQTCRENIIEDNLLMGAFWTPANYFVYALPMHLRMPVQNVISLAWCTILSLWRGHSGEAIEDCAAPHVELGANLHDFDCQSPQSLILEPSL